MVQSPSLAANWFATTQEIPRISPNLKVHYCTHKPPPPVSILSQSIPVHIPTSHLLEIHPNIIHPSTPRSPQWSLSLRFPHQDLIFPCTCITLLFDPFGVDRNVMNAHLHNGLMKRPYRTCICMNGDSSVENLSCKVNTLSCPKCPRFLVQLSENMPAFLQSIMGTLHLSHLKFDGAE